MIDLSNENVIHIKKDGIQYLQFKKLLEYKDKITHAYTLGIEKSYRARKKEGLNLDQEKLKAEDNYKELCNNLDLKYENLVCSNQTHTDMVKCIKSPINFEQEGIEVDGLCTNVKEITLATVNADCILFLFYDPAKNVIANCHSGWKGTLKRISIKTIEKMQEEYGCDPKDIICCINPSIRKCHFEVEKDVKDMFENEFNDLENLNEIIEETEANKKWCIDTIEINKQILTRVGLQEENIIDSKICSVCNKNLVHSFRVEKEGYGLATAVINLK